MAENTTDMEIDNNLLDGNKIIFKPDKPTYFTCLQIKNLLKLQLLDVSPYNCLMLVSSALKLDNIEDNFRHFWLADIITVVVQNIQRMRMTVSQGTAVVGWISHFISLAVDEKWSKAKLFETLYKYDKLGLANADEFMIPAIADIQECPNYNIRTTKSSTRSKYDFNPTLTPVTQTAQQMLMFITNTIHEIFWDDFKYTVIQMAFDNEQPERTQRSEVAKAKTTQIKNNLKRFYAIIKNKDEIKEHDYTFKCCAKMDRYFIRESNYNKSPLSNKDQFWNL